MAKRSYLGYRTTTPQSLGQLHAASEPQTEQEMMAIIILSDGSVYRGHVVAGQHTKRASKKNSKIQLIFELSTQQGETP